MSRARCWFTAVLRRILLLALSLVVLLSALVLMWLFRFEVLPGSPIWDLKRIRATAVSVAGSEWIGTGADPALRLWVDPAHPQVALRLALPGMPAVEMLHLRLCSQARGLRQGAEKWQTGRFMIEWHPIDGSGRPELDPIGGSVDDKSSCVSSMVAVSAKGPAIPTLRLEHLGRAGEFILTDLEIIPVRERMLWKYGRWLLAAGFLSWLFACIRLLSGSGRPLALAAALIWLFMGIQFVVPGPWKIQRPLLFGNFRLGECLVGGKSEQALSPMPSGTEIVYSGGVEAGGRILPQGSLALRIKILISKARILLHVLLLFAPSLVSAWLVGRRATLWLAILCAAAIELAQLALGYGFGWLDVLDLFTDAAGIAAALWLSGRLPRWLARDPGH